MEIFKKQKMILKVMRFLKDYGIFVFYVSKEIFGMFDCCGKTMFGFTVFSNVLLDGDVFCDSGMNLQNLLIWIFLKLKTGVGI